MAAHTVIKSAIEANFCLAALVEDSEAALNIMKHSYLKQNKKQNKDLISLGHTQFVDGTDIQTTLDDVNERLRDFIGMPSSIWALAQMGNKSEDYKTSYQLCCQHSHPASLITALYDQIGPGPDVNIRVGYQDVIKSNHFTPIAGIGLDCIAKAAELIGAELSDQFHILRREIDEEVERFLQE